MQQHTILLITSEEVGWTELRKAVESIERLAIVGEATSTQQATRLAETLRPSTIISTMHLGGESTLSLLADIRHSISPTSRILVVDFYFGVEELAELATLDLSGLVLWKDFSRSTLHHCLATITLGNMEEQPLLCWP